MIAQPLPTRAKDNSTSLFEIVAKAINLAAYRLLTLHYHEERNDYRSYEGLRKGIRQLLPLFKGEEGATWATRVETDGNVSRWPVAKTLSSQRTISRS